MGRLDWKIMPGNKRIDWKIEVTGDAGSMKFAQKASSQGLYLKLR